jgi:hypothetical protein
MSTREKPINITADTTSGQFVIKMRGRHSVSVQGNFGGGTLTHYIYTSAGRGAAARAATTTAEAYESHVQRSEFVLTGSTTPDLNIVLTDIPGL